jgi:nickel transport protein
MRQKGLQWGVMVWMMGGLPPVWAHSVDIQYQMLPSYRITATYDGGQPMAQAQVAIFAPDQPAKPWEQGQTDTQGQFAFTPSQAGNWEVRVRQAGHGQLLVIPVTNGQQNPESEPTASVQPVSRSERPDLHWGQRGLILGSVVWGCIGTALFFSRRRESADHASP